MILLEEKTKEALSSLGSNPYMILVENEPLTVRDGNSIKPVYVKCTVEGDSTVVQFGIFRRDDKSNYIDTSVINPADIEGFLSSPRLNGVDFSEVFGSFNAIEVEVNSELRFINYQRRLYRELINTVYIEGKLDTLSLAGASLKGGMGSLKLEPKIVNTFYEYFDDRICRSYDRVLNLKIFDYLKKRNDVRIKAYNSFKVFIPVLFRGKCVINPLLDSYKIGSKVKETDLYLRANRFRIDLSADNSVYFLSNKEICESLGLSNYLRFTANQFSKVLLGLVDPTRYPSVDRMVSLNEANRLVPADSPEATRSVSSLYHLCLVYQNSVGLKDRDVDQYFSILSKASLF